MILTMMWTSTLTHKYLCRPLKVGKLYSANKKVYTEIRWFHFDVYNMYQKAEMAATATKEENTRSMF